MGQVWIGSVSSGSAMARLLVTVGIVSAFAAGCSTNATTVDLQTTEVPSLTATTLSPRDRAISDAGNFAVLLAAAAEDNEAIAVAFDSAAAAAAQYAVVLAAVPDPESRPLPEGISAVLLDALESARGTLYPHEERPGGLPGFADELVRMAGDWSPGSVGAAGRWADALYAADRAIADAGGTVMVALLGNDDGALLGAADTLRRHADAVTRAYADVSAAAEDGQCAAYAAKRGSEWVRTNIPGCG